MFFCFVFEFVFKERREREKKGEGFFCFSGGGGGRSRRRLMISRSAGKILFSPPAALVLSLSLPLSPSEATYLLGQLAGEELVQLGVEDAVGDELFFIFYFSRW